MCHTGWIAQIFSLFTKAFNLCEVKRKADFIKLGAVFPISESDLSVIERLDQAAFAPPWQMDGDALRETWRRSIWASGFHREGRLAGFLLATPTPQGVHISRLAVHPEHQNKGIGRSLTGCLLEPGLAGAAPGDRFQFERLGYFCADPDTTAEKPVFNRTVGLRDTWAKIQDKG